MCLHYIYARTRVEPVAARPLPLLRRRRRRRRLLLLLARPPPAGGGCCMPRRRGVRHAEVAADNGGQGNGACLLWFGSRLVDLFVCSFFVRLIVCLFFHLSVRLFLVVFVRGGTLLGWHVCTQKQTFRIPQVCMAFDSTNIWNAPASGRACSAGTRPLLRGSRSAVRACVWVCRMRPSRPIPCFPPTRASRLVSTDTNKPCYLPSSIPSQSIKPNRRRCPLHPPTAIRIHSAYVPSWPEDPRA